MKIKIKKIDFNTLQNLKKPKHKRPLKPMWLLGALIRIISIPELLAVKFKYTKERMEQAKGPCLILMNHSSFIDMKIAFRIFFPKRFSIVCTTDAYIGKSLLMRLLGCIPTNKFVTDVSLISDIIHTLKKNKTSVLMYPEAGYSFDGRSTALPPKLGVLIKKLGVPVVTVITDGAFLRDPLYNGLQKRKVKVTAHAKCLLTPEEIKLKTAEEITALINEDFSFDGFENQAKSNTKITESFRADGLHRILYRCPNCETEDQMVGLGTSLSCKNCGKSYELNTLGKLVSNSGKTEFPHIPDWYAWERECVKKEIESGNYSLKCDVKIAALCDHKALYMIGDGVLTHSTDGFHLIGCDGKLDYTHDALSSYSLNSDYFWYEIGDVICIGDRKILYYCFPKEKTNVTKARLAAEEIYKLKKNNNG